MVILEKAEDGEPFEPWDGSTTFEGLVSKSAAKLVRTAGPNSNFYVGPLTLDQAIALHWRVRDWKLEVGMDGLSASADGASVALDGLVGQPVSLFNRITPFRDLVTVGDASFWGYDTVEDTTKISASAYDYNDETGGVAYFQMYVVRLGETSDVNLGNKEIAKDANGQYWLSGFAQVFPEIFFNAYGYPSDGGVTSRTYTNEEMDMGGANFGHRTDVIDETTKIVGAPNIMQIEIRLPGMTEHLVCPCLGTKVTLPGAGTVNFNPIRLRFTPDKYFTYGGLYDETSGEKA